MPAHHFRGQYIDISIEHIPFQIKLICSKILKSVTRKEIRNSMARRVTQVDCIQSVSFERVKEHIRAFFDILLRRVAERRDQLLTQLCNIEFKYNRKEESRKKQVKELEMMLKQMIQISVKENPVMDVKLNQMNMIMEEKEKCQQPTPVPLIQFKADLSTHLDELNKIGVVDSSSIYSIKGNPVSSFGKGELNRPFGIYLDQDEKVYVCDFGNGKIQVFSKEGDFISEFGKGQLDKPHGIAVNDEWVFVADWGMNAVSKFQKSDYKFVNRSKGAGLQNPKDLALDKDSNVLVADYGNNRIAVLDSELKFKRKIGKGMLKRPCGIHINLNKIFVVDYKRSHNVHVFSLAGDLVHSIINLKIGKCLISKNFGRHHIFLCFDQFGNFIISATEDKSIQIYTIEGNLLHSIKCEGYPTGIAAKKDDTIVCAMYDPSCIKFC